MWELKITCTYIYMYGRHHCIKEMIMQCVWSLCNINVQLVKSRGDTVMTQFGRIDRRQFYVQYMYHSTLKTFSITH